MSGTKQPSLATGLFPSRLHENLALEQREQSARKLSQKYTTKRKGENAENSGDFQEAAHANVVGAAR
jgi:hypothetical protein